MGTRFYRGDGAFVFPVRFLAAELEKLAVDVLLYVLSGHRGAQRVPKGWVITMMRKVKVPFPTLLETYLDLYEPNGKPEDRFLIISSFAQLVLKWHEFAVSPEAGEYERGNLRVQVHRLLLTKAAEYKGVLRTLTGSLPTDSRGENGAAAMRDAWHSEVQDLIATLTRMEAKISKFVEQTPF